MVAETSPKAVTPSESCRPEPVSAEIFEILECFDKDEDFKGWTWVRDYGVGSNVLKLCSRNRKETDLKEFLVYGEIDVCKERLIELVMHMSRRKHWDDTYIEHEDITTDGKGTDILFSASKYPFPLAKRTYTVSRTVYGSMDSTVLIYSTVIPYNYPKKYKWSTQVEEFESVLMVRNCKDKPDYCKIAVTYFENPRVILPNTYLNLIIETLVPKVLEKMVIACKEHGSPTYMEYCQNLICVPVPEKKDGPQKDDSSVV